MPIGVLTKRLCMKLFYLKENTREIKKAYAEHRDGRYFSCFLLFGHPRFGVTFHLSDHPWFNEGKWLTELTLGRWPD